METYFNTTELKGKELKKANTLALSQQQQVYYYLYQFDDWRTRSQISRDLEMQDINIRPESVGRCLTNLLNEGKVIKSANTQVTCCGLGRPEYSYKIVSNFHLLKILNNV